MKVHGGAVYEVDEARKTLTNWRDRLLKERIEVVRRVVLMEVVGGEVGEGVSV